MEFRFLGSWEEVPAGTFSSDISKSVLFILNRIIVFLFSHLTFHLNSSITFLGTHLLGSLSFLSPLPAFSSN